MKITANFISCQYALLFLTAFNGADLIAGSSIAVASDLPQSTNYLSQLTESDKHLIPLQTNWLAQVNQDPTPIPEPLTPGTSPLPQPTQLDIDSADLEEVEIKSIQVMGDTILTQEQIDSITQPLVGKTITIAQLKLAIDDLTQIYLEQGYITSRALLVEDSVETGEIQIQLIEGSVSAVEVEGSSRLEKYVRDRVNLAIETPLSSAKLEDQLRLLRLNPLFDNVEASISAGDTPEIGKSVVKVRVTEADRHNVRVGIDNYSPSSVGSERLGFDYSYRSLIHPGDRISARYYPRVEAFFDTFDLGIEYQIPVNAKNGTVTTGISLNRNEVIDPLGEDFDDLEIEGESEKFNLGFRQPIIRDPRQELALSIAYDYQDGQTLLFQEGARFGLGADEEGNTTTSVFRFGQEYVRRQVSGAWAFRSQFNLGANILGATENDEPIPDSQFVSWLGQAQRVQVLNNNNFLVIQADVQLTGNSLLPSQQFVIGGGQSVRGYRQNARSGDNGFVFSIEDRLTLLKNKAGEASLTFTPFFNLGTVWNNDGNPNELPEETFLAAFGIGFIWEPIDGLNVQLDYAPPLTSLDDGSDSLQDDGLHFSIDYAFSF
ncbi:MAG: ShlB/FhaC/HecB family hemolysin secretion/activation protein [Cyanobacteria bacterium J06600_6]